jgi:hypothetical protein
VRTMTAPDQGSGPAVGGLSHQRVSFNSAGAFVVRFDVIPQLSQTYVMSTSPGTDGISMGSPGLIGSWQPGQRTMGGSGDMALPQYATPVAAKRAIWTVMRHQKAG